MRQAFAGFRQRETSRYAFEEREAYGFFELADLHRYRGLCEVEFLGCAGEAGAAARYHEDLELAQG
ncbi:hypothetical protein BSFA1_43850 [Burkholderia sp. SFA1]|nr:hypothetical protein BSFA1_43850 [Burkholderia sp. SFA1]